MAPGTQRRLHFEKKVPYKNNSPGATRRKQIAVGTLAAIGKGSYSIDDTTYPLSSDVEGSKQHTRYYGPDSILADWEQSRPTLSGGTSPTATDISFLEISTLEGARYLASRTSDTIGVLNFASAKKPGGGFLGGASAQEESIARSSALYPTLMTSEGQKFYVLHKNDPHAGYYTHAMIYSPGVTLFRDDSGGWLEPLKVDVLTSPAVNAGVVRKTVRARLAPDGEEAQIRRVMKERMGRLLYLFEREGVKHLVLGSFGTGVFRNDIPTIAEIWAELLGTSSTRFGSSFETILFAVIGGKTFEQLRDSFEESIRSASSSG
ncbi:hypothetical protein HGRIS_001952 [Hohenbuehelia grisea]|uniref:Microbial-type PARG catalytic domain-containing protein n=1 Tax=Hohenbuehelia grisea TaxID=104357 RepID=A0ABR3JKS4_9AGAR